MIKQIKNLGIGLFIAQLFSVLNQLIIARFYSPEILGEYSLAIQLSVVVSLIFFFRREYFIVEIKRKILALYYINHSFFEGIKRLVIPFILVLILNYFFDYFSFQILIFSLLFGILISYSVSLQQIFNMRIDFFTSGITEAIQKTSYFISLIFFSIFAEDISTLNFISISFLFALIVRIVYSLLKLESFKIPKIFNKIQNKLLRFDEQTSKGMVLSKNNAIAAITGLLPTLFIIEFYSLKDLGYFTMAITLLSLPTSLIGNSVSQVMYEHLSTYKTNRNLKDINLVLKLLILSSLAFLILYFFGEFLVIDIALGPNWQNSLDIIYILIPSFMISYISKPFEKSCYLFEKKKWHIFSSIMKLSFISIAVALSYLFKADFSIYVLFYCIATCAHYFIDFCYNYHLISRS